MSRADDVTSSRHVVLTEVGRLGSYDDVIVSAIDVYRPPPSPHTVNVSHCSQWTEFTK